MCGINHPHPISTHTKSSETQDGTGRVTVNTPTAPRRTFHAVLPFAPRLDVASVSFTAPTEEQLAEYPFTYEEDFHGSNGPVQTAIPRTSYRSDKMFLDTLVNQGFELLKDPYGGDVRFSSTHSLIHRSKRALTSSR